MTRDIIAQFNESALYALGFDRPTVAALRNIIRIVGTATNSTTVPEVSMQADNTAVMLTSLSNEVDNLRASLSLMEVAGMQALPDLSGIDAAGMLPVVVPLPPVEHLTTEVRQLAERVAQFTEHFTTEVRQLADAQVVNTNLIQELKQGTML